MKKILLLLSLALCINPISAKDNFLDHCTKWIEHFNLTIPHTILAGAIGIGFGYFLYRDVQKSKTLETLTSEICILKKEVQSKTHHEEKFDPFKSKGWTLANDIFLSSNKTIQHMQNDIMHIKKSLNQIQESNSTIKTIIPDPLLEVAGNVPHINARIFTKQPHEFGSSFEYTAFVQSETLKELDRLAAIVDRKK